MERITGSFGTVVITGGTRGIGASIASELQKYDATVIATGTNKEEIERLNNSNSNDRLEYLHLNFLEPESVNQALSYLNKLERVDSLVNNAGINRINPVWDVKEEDWDSLMAVNLKGVFLLTQEIAKHMKHQRMGRILNIASIFGVVSKEKRSTYSTTKFGLLGFTKGAALDLGPYNVLVNAMSPGFVMTELTKSILSESEMLDLAENVPLKRFAQPSEIAKSALFLISEENTYITGQNIVIDGGFVSG